MPSSLTLAFDWSTWILAQVVGKEVAGESNSEAWTGKVHLLNRKPRQLLRRQRATGKTERDRVSA